MHIRRARRGFTLVELLVVIVVIAILIALLLPAIQAAREAGRMSTCRNNMHQIGVALASYHDSYNTFPVGVDASGAANVPQGYMTNYRRNWVIHLFPFMEQQALYDSVNWRQLVGVSGGLTNYAAGVVTYNAFTSVAIPSLLCPSDIHNDTMWSVDRSGASIYAPPPPPSAYQTYGRLNYGANSCLMPPFNYYSSTNPNGLGYNDPCGGPTMEAWTPVIPHSWMTRGVMGWGTSLGIRQITDGASTTVAVWEIRAGLNSADFRGSWADGRPAGSTLWFHLLGPNVCYPANVWLAGDDIAGEWLSVSTALGANWQAIETQECMVMTSSSSGPASGMPRSTHPSGENALFCDGSVRWVSDLVDRGQVVNWYGDFTNPWGGNPARMGTWERLNASGDGLPIEEDRLDP